MENIINEIIRGESGKTYESTPCTHGGIMWVTDETGWSSLKTPAGEDALALSIVKEIKGSSCQLYVACAHCGLLMVEPEKRSPGLITRPPVGSIIQKD